MYRKTYSNYLFCVAHRVKVNKICTCLHCTCYNLLDRAKRVICGPKFKVTNERLVAVTVVGIIDHYIDRESFGKQFN